MLLHLWAAEAVVRMAKLFNGVLPIASDTRRVRVPSNLTSPASSSKMPTQATAREHVQGAMVGAQLAPSANAAALFADNVLRGCSMDN